MTDPPTGEGLSDENLVRSPFGTTHWSVVLEAARPDSPGGVEAFARLYRDYWYPLYVYVRRRGRGVHEAEELTQGFFVTLLEKKRLAGLDHESGRFRSFLLKSMQNFLANEWDRATALKRGGAYALGSLEEVDPESRFLAEASGESPEAGFDRHWAFTVLEHALHNLEAEAEATGKGRLFQQIRPFLQGDRNGRPYAEIATELGLSTNGVKSAVHRLKRRFGEVLRAEVARTVGTEADVSVELRYLISIVSAGSPEQ